MRSELIPSAATAIGHSSRGRRKLLPLLFAFLVVAVLVACDKPDASHVTSPSARSLLGTTMGAAVYEAEGEPPAATTDSEGWEFQLGNARYSTLENGETSIQVVTRLVASPGATMEFWVWNEAGHIPLYWSGGTSAPYNGVFCFQILLEDGEESLHFEDEQYYLTVGFRNQESGEWEVVKRQRIAGGVPRLEGEIPDGDSEVGTGLLGCPRSVI